MKNFGLMIMCPESHSHKYPDVTIIIPNYNGLEHLKDCLPSLSSLDYPNEKIHIMVVDNASTDESMKYLQETYPDILVLSLPENMGFARAINYGVSQVKTNLVAFLNNDMRVDKSWLTPLVSAINKNNNILCTCSEILDWQGKKIDYSGGLLNFCGYGISLDRGNTPVMVEPAEKTKNTLFPCGGSMLIDKQAFQEVGGFDNDYFAYYEDVDLGFRLWMNGYSVLLVRDSTVFHKGFGTGRNIALVNRHFLWHRNALYTIFKNFEDKMLKKMFPAILFLAVERGLSFMAQENAAETFIKWIQQDKKNDPIILAPEQQDALQVGYAQMKALSAFFNSLPDLVSKRQEIQSNRKYTDKDIFAQNNLVVGFNDMFTLPHYELFQSKIINYFDLNLLFKPNELRRYYTCTLHKLDQYIIDRLKHIKNLETQNKHLTDTSSHYKSELDSLARYAKNLEKTVQDQEQYIKSLQAFEMKVKSSLGYKVYGKIKSLLFPGFK